MNNHDYSMILSLLFIFQMRMNNKMNPMNINSDQDLLSLLRFMKVYDDEKEESELYVVRKNEYGYKIMFIRVPLLYSLSDYQRKEVLIQISNKINQFSRNVLERFISELSEYVKQYDDEYIFQNIVLEFNNKYDPMRLYENYVCDMSMRIIINRM